MSCHFPFHNFYEKFLNSLLYTIIAKIDKKETEVKEMVKESAFRNAQRQLDECAKILKYHPNAH
ncbi:MAG: hypothetical protein U9O90_08020, partial [Euryarchaeota archaeon]|nr:hypothetical protein [Euryarchaeota archaeon]